MSAWEGRGQGRGQRGRGGGGRGTDRGGSRGGGYADRGGPRGGGYADRGGPRGGGFRGGGGGGGGRGGRGGAPVQVFSSTDRTIPTPDARVTKVENALQAAAKGSLGFANLNLKEGLPFRPGYGTRGAEVVLWANYFEMAPPSDMTLYRYDVSVTPAATGKKLTQIIRLLLEAQELNDYRQDAITDFKSTLISRKRFENDDWTLEVKYRMELEDDPREDATVYRVRLQYTNTLSVSELVQYLTSTNMTTRFDDQLSLIQALNIFLNHYSKSSGNLTTIGASKSFSLTPNAAKWDLGAGLTAIRGFFSSVRVAACRVLVNVNVSHGAFYEQGPLDGLVIKYQASTGNRGDLRGYLQRLKIITTHLREKRNRAGQVIHRQKAICGFATPQDGRDLAHPPRVRSIGAGPKDVEFWLDTPGQSAPGPSTQSQGPPGSPTVGKRKGKKGKKGGQPGPAPPPETSSGRYISVYDFFLNTHNKRIARPDLPVINVGTIQNPSYLPLEVCVVVPGQASRKQLSPEQTQQMIRFAVRKPWENATSIVDEGFQTVGLASQTNPLMQRFSISIWPKLITVPGRVLAEPRVFYKENQSARVNAGSWNMVHFKFNTAGALKRWSYMLLTVPEFGNAFNTIQDLGQVVASFQRTLQETGIATEPPTPGVRLNLNNQDDPQLDVMIGRAAERFSLLLIVLPRQNMPVYNRIKQLGDVKYGIQTICVVGERIAKERGQDQYFHNVALKFNLKLGGNNHLIDSSRFGIIKEDNTMVVGIDVTHPSPGSSSAAPSVAGMVASVDRWLGQWPATLRIQTGRTEMVADLANMLKSRLQLWKSKGKHKTLPENILVYRDGVSEGQYNKVVNEEIPLLRKACKEMYPAPDQKKGLPRFTVIIVGKRHHTRFYPTREADADRSANPRPGTVVDRGVTEPRNWDFFLQSHAALQGTARPGHYFVVLDEIFRNRYKQVPPGYNNVADIVEELTQSMCYMYGRATKAVSVCTPAYYADVVCERARCYLSRLFNTPAPSVAGSVAGGVTGTADDSDVAIHDRLKDTMFYI